MYTSPIWSPFKLQDIKRIESVQHHFFRMLRRKTGMPMHPFEHDYSSISSKFNIITLEASRAHCDLSFIFNVLNGKIKCTTLEALIFHRNLDYSLRNPRVLSEYKYTRNYASESTIPRFIRLYNALPIQIRNINHAPLFKKDTKRYVSANY